jgi:hypothetical protein
VHAIPRTPWMVFRKLLDGSVVGAVQGRRGAAMCGRLATCVAYVSDK